MNPTSAHESRDLTQVFSDAKTYMFLVFGFFVLSFILYLGGSSGITQAINWAGDLENAVFFVGGPPALFVLGIVLILLGFHEYEEYNLIRNTPTSTIRSVPVGRVEVKGRAHPLRDENLLEAPFTGEPCVVYECKVEEYHSDDDGGDWHTIYSNRKAPPFLLRDETGELVVDPADAEWALGDWDYRKELNENESSLRIKEFVKNQLNESSVLDVDLLGGERRRFSENRLHPEDDVYVLGAATPVEDHPQLDANVSDLFLGMDHNTGLFYLSDRSESEIIRSKWWGIIGLIVSGTTLAPAAAVTFCYVLGVL